MQAIDKLFVEWREELIFGPASDGRAENEADGNREHYDQPAFQGFAYMHMHSYLEIFRAAVRGCHQPGKHSSQIYFLPLFKMVNKFNYAELAARCVSICMRVSPVSSKLAIDETCPLPSIPLSLYPPTYQVKCIYILGRWMEFNCIYLAPRPHAAPLTSASRPRRSITSTPLTTRCRWWMEEPDKALTLLMSGPCSRPLPSTSRACGPRPRRRYVAGAVRALRRALPATLYFPQPQG